MEEEDAGGDRPPGEHKTREVEPALSRRAERDPADPRPVLGEPQGTHLALAFPTFYVEDAQLVERGLEVLAGIREDEFELPLTFERTALGAEPPQPRAAGRGIPRVRGEVEDRVARHLDKLMAGSSLRGESLGECGGGRRTSRHAPEVDEVPVILLEREPDQSGRECFVTGRGEDAGVVALLRADELGDTQAEAAPGAERGKRDQLARAARADESERAAAAEVCPPRQCPLRRSEDRVLPERALKPLPLCSDLGEGGRVVVDEPREAVRPAFVRGSL